jgi:hypothetical protein
MAAGDAQRVWFPEMIDQLREAWSLKMTWEELADFCAHITVFHLELRRAKGIRAPLTRCRGCGHEHRKEIGGVTIRSALFALRKHRVITERRLEILDKSWKKHRAKHGLDAFGRPKQPPATPTACGHRATR